MQAYGVSVCNGCSRSQQHPGNGGSSGGGCGRYELISRSNAKQQFLLTDRDLRPLGSLERPNPQNQRWAGMRLYLASQVGGCVCGDGRNLRWEGNAGHEVTGHYPDCQSLTAVFWCHVLNIPACVESSQCYITLVFANHLASARHTAFLLPSV
jgi:hypothetical protein